MAVFTIDFVARAERGNEWLIVLVESGPWTGSIEQNLHRLQKNLYDCVDAVLDGQLAEKFPQFVGMHLTIRVDFYNVNRSDVEPFFDSFATGALGTGDYKKAVASSPFVKGIAFEANFDSIH